MDCHNIYSVEGGKKRFTDMVRVKALYNEKHHEISDEIHEVRSEIKKADGLISQTVNELAAAVFMRKSKKQKKYSYIEELKERKSAGLERISALEEKLKQLKIDTFESEELPKLCIGKYPVTSDGEPEPLEWDVININKDSALMICVNIIEQMPFAGEIENTPWKNSLIRRWTNEVFYKEAMSDEEREIITGREIANPGNVSYKTADSPNTRDFIFIPSVNDMRRAYTYDGARIAYATEYAAGKGLYVDEETKGSYWWLRSNGGNMYNASAVNFEGYIFEYGFYVNTSYIGVRPAMWISLK